MKPPTLSTLFALASSAYAAAVPSHLQDVLADPAILKVRVPGHNRAYYTQVEAKDQLFEVRELVIYPDPPAPNSHIFVYLDGWISSRHLAGLENATISISGACLTPYDGGEGKLRVETAHGETRKRIRRSIDLGLQRTALGYVLLVLAGACNGEVGLLGGSDG
ncbi:hypothetical protein BU26DRAFT_553423 [Trematosphaeria pertusa]|uniref:Uncharacterized protein n=1 Tax=Trematosphaeria pertusa TaxID=390896 RepID=A0A6A6I4V5_9PLEO|nr:uncharacterized protein BU26DRAFT_553423 [Trematosphaeria pertusa]KAF2245564.1 hypothetical protein BU26DRAFT_553423 [Trematosphaeria pertusa]